MEICAKEKCTGCGACANACALKCITLQNDSFGELHPVVDETRCVQCNACLQACPNNRPPQSFAPRKCYAAWVEDVAKRRLSATGGIATALAAHVVSEGGVFLGTRYDDAMTPRVCFAETIEELEAYRGSKYAHSVIDDVTFSQVRNYLRSGRIVLFVGTPCQIAALRTFLRMDYDNLLTADLLCHGVCPTHYFTEEVAYLKQRHRIRRVTDVRFRSNDSHNYYFTMWDGERLQYARKAHCEYYYAGFLNSLALRENCYSCQYARPERVADVTLGDFLGLGKQQPFVPKARNVSCVLLNTEKAESFFQQVLDATPDICFEERSLAERLIYPYSILEPTKPHPRRKQFRQACRKHGYSKAIRQVTRFKIFRSRMWEKARQYPILNKVLQKYLGI